MSGIYNALKITPQVLHFNISIGILFLDSHILYTSYLLLTLQISNLRKDDTCRIRVLEIRPLVLSRVLSGAILYFMTMGYTVNLWIILLNSSIFSVEKNDNICFRRDTT